MATATLKPTKPTAEKRTGHGCSCACHSAKAKSLISLIAVGLAGASYFIGTRV